MTRLRIFVHLWKIKRCRNISYFVYNIIIYCRQEKMIISKCNVKMIWKKFIEFSGGQSWSYSINGKLSRKETWCIFYSTFSQNYLKLCSEFPSTESTIRTIHFLLSFKYLIDSRRVYFILVKKELWNLPAVQTFDISMAISIDGHLIYRTEDYILDERYRNDKLQLLPIIVLEYPATEITRIQNCW